MENFTGTREIHVRSEVINTLYEDKFLDIYLENRVFDKRLKFSAQNEYITLESNDSTSSALAIVKGERLVLLENNKSVSSISARNREQRFALNALMDDSIKVVVLTGKAGTGKTLLTLAASLDRTESPNTPYSKIILTRPMSWVGRHGLGALPGDVDEKFRPYLENYMCNLEYMMGGNKKTIGDAIAQLNMEFIPIQLIRGASWANSFIIADEVQVLDCEEMKTLGTRVGENGKIIIMGDLNQRDERIAKEKTGIHKFINSVKAQADPLVATVDLVKCERSPVAALFADIFED